MSKSFTNNDCPSRVRTSFVARLNIISFPLDLGDGQVSLCNIPDLISSPQRLVTGSPVYVERRTKTFSSK